MLLLELSHSLTEFFAEWTYLGPFVVLFLCGIGLPLPEEVTLIGAGFLVYEGQAEYIPITIICSVAILLGDSIPFWLGRKYGISLLRESRWLRKLISPRQIDRVQQKFDKHGSWATFLFRFFAGVRIPGYFVSGSLGLSYPRFLILDALGVLISVPISIFLGMWFGGRVDELKESMEYFHTVLAFLVIAMVIVFVWKAFRRPRRESDSDLKLGETLEHPPKSAEESRSEGVEAPQEPDGENDDTD